MSTEFIFDPAILAMLLLIPIGIIIVVWIALRKYFETRQIGFLSIALAFMLTQVFFPIASLLHFVDFRVIIWVLPSVFILFLALIAYGLLRLSPKLQGKTELPSGEKLSLFRQLSLLAGITTITAVFNGWAAYGYSYRTPTGGAGGGGGSFSLLDAFLLPSIRGLAELEQINLNTLVIGSTLAAVLLFVAGLGCIVKDARWSVFSVAGLIAFFIAYVGSPGSNIIVATASHSASTGVTGWQMALSLGPILSALGIAIGLAALVLNLQRGVSSTH